MLALQSGIELRMILMRFSSESPKTLSPWRSYAKVLKLVGVPSLAAGIWNSRILLPSMVRACMPM